jgi:hypothetical protein
MNSQLFFYLSHNIGFLSLLDPFHKKHACSDFSHLKNPLLIPNAL